MLLAEHMASTAAMRGVFSARASVQAMLDVEAALAAAGAACARLPAEAAAAIKSACTADAVDIDHLADAGALAGTIVVPLVKWLKAAAGPHGTHVHLGGTSQDVIDNALMLQLRAGLALLDADLATMSQAATALTIAHADTKLTARTLLQAALPTSFGLKTAYWRAAIEDSRAALTRAAAEAIRLQCGGAAGTLDAVADQAEPFMAAFGAALNLPVPVLPWQTSRAPLLRLAAAITGTIGVAAKIGTDIALMMQTEVEELTEPAAPGRGTSSAMAHKRNPTLSIAARAAATRAPGLLAALATAQVQEHERAAGAWQAEAAIWPALMLCASGALAAIAEALPGLIVNDAAMAKNLANLPEAPPGAAATLIRRALES